MMKRRTFLGRIAATVGALVGCGTQRHRPRRSKPFIHDSGQYEDGSNEPGAGWVDLKDYRSVTLLYDVESSDWVSYGRTVPLGPHPLPPSVLRS